MGVSRLSGVLGMVGVYAGRVERRPYGQNMLLDIDRLAAAWEAPVRTVFDVGANIGQSAREFSHHFTEADIMSFEPHPSTFAALKHNTEDLSRVKVHNLALGDEAGSVPFYEYDNSLINSRIPDAAYPQRKGMQPRQIQVEQQTLDGFCRDRGIKAIDFLKVDTEGFDDRVMAGAADMLSRHAIRFVSCEVAISSEGRATNALAIGNILAPFGYTLFSTYYDYVIPKGRFFANGNALFICPDSGTA